MAIGPVILAIVLLSISASNGKSLSDQNIGHDKQRTNPCRPLKGCGDALQKSSREVVDDIENETEKSKVEVQEDLVQRGSSGDDVESEVKTKISDDKRLEDLALLRRRESPCKGNTGCRFGQQPSDFKERKQWWGVKNDSNSLYTWSAPVHEGEDVKSDAKTEISDDKLLDVIALFRRNQPCKLNTGCGIGQPPSGEDVKSKVKTEIFDDKLLEDLALFRRQNPAKCRGNTGCGLGQNPSDFKERKEIKTDTNRPFGQVPKGNPKLEGNVYETEKVKSEISGNKRLDDTALFRRKKTPCRGNTGCRFGEHPSGEDVEREMKKEVGLSNDELLDDIALSRRKKCRGNSGCGFRDDPSDLNSAKNNEKSRLSRRSDSHEDGEYPDDYDYSYDEFLAYLLKLEKDNGRPQ